MLGVTIYPIIGPDLKSTAPDEGHSKQIS